MRVRGPGDGAQARYDHVAHDFAVVHHQNRGHFRQTLGSCSARVKAAHGGETWRNATLRCRTISASVWASRARFLRACTVRRSTHYKATPARTSAESSGSWTI